MVDGPFAFTQDLTWINNISSNIVRLRGDKGIEPEVIAFYKPENSKKEKFNIEPFDGME